MYSHLEYSQPNMSPEMAGLKKLVGVSVDFYFLHKSPKCVIEGQLLSSFCFLVGLGLPRLSVSITAFLTSSSSFPERGVSWRSCSRQGDWGAFPPFVCVLSHLSGFPLGTASEPGEPVSLRAALPLSGWAWW